MATHFGVKPHGLICGYLFTPDGDGQPIDLARVIEWLEAPQAGPPAAFIWMRQSTEEFSLVIRDLAAVQERIKLLQEEIAAQVSEQTNRSLFTLTMVTVLALPINITTSFFGMNICGIPFAECKFGFLTAARRIVYGRRRLARFPYAGIEAPLHLLPGSAALFRRRCAWQRAIPAHHNSTAPLQQGGSTQGGRRP